MDWNKILVIIWIILNVILAGVSVTALVISLKNKRELDKRAS